MTISKLISNSSSSTLRDILFNDIIADINSYDVIIEYLSFPFLVNVHSLTIIDDLFSNWNESFNKVIQAFKINEHNVKSWKHILNAHKLILNTIEKNMNQYDIPSLRFLILAIESIVKTIPNIQLNRLDDEDENVHDDYLYNRNLILKLMSRIVISMDHRSKKDLVDDFNSLVLIVMKEILRLNEHIKPSIESIHEIIFSESNQRSYWNQCKSEYLKEMILMWKSCFHFFDELFNDKKRTKDHQNILDALYPIMKEGLSVNVKKINETVILWYQSFYMKATHEDLNQPRGLSRLLKEYKEKYNLSLPIMDDIGDSLNSMSSSPIHSSDKGVSSFEGSVPSPSLVYPLGVFQIICIV